MDGYRVIAVGQAPERWALERIAEEGGKADRVAIFATREEANAALGRIRLASLAHSQSE